MRIISVERTVGMLLAMSVSMLAQASDAVNAVYPVKIASQPLGTALQELATQSGIQIIFLSNIADGHDAPALNGTFSPRTALDTLLRGTDLTFQQLNDKTIEVRSQRAFRRTSHAAAGEVLPRMSAFEPEVSGASFHDVTRPLRLAQAETGSPTGN